MADTKYYAWSTFQIGRDEWGRTTKTVEPGEEVTAEKLGVSKEQFQEWIDGGSVRTMKFPDMEPGFLGSPIEWYRQQAAKAADLAASNAYAEVLPNPVETPVTPT